MCVDLREMSDQKLTQILPFDPKISAKKDILRKLEKVKVQKKNENAIFANIDCITK